jgi:lipopolysaccharide export LptBFGC system permease protein LptF
MAVLLASLVTFGRLSEENELTAVRAAGVALWKAIWMPPVFALAISALMIPFNTAVAPWANRVFRGIYEDLIHSEPLISVVPKKFFAIKNIKIYADAVDLKKNLMRDIFVYQINADGRPADRIFAHEGSLASDENAFRMHLKAGQLQRYDALKPDTLIHTVFDNYEITVPLKMDEKTTTTRYRNLTSQELRQLMNELRKQGIKTSALQAEESLRYAIAFAPLCLAMVGIPLATALRKGGRSFGFGMTIVVIFAYYLLLIFGLTMAEKGLIQPDLSLWMGNITCLVTGSFLFYRLGKM